MNNIRLNGQITESSTSKKSLFIRTVKGPTVEKESGYRN